MTVKMIATIKRFHCVAADEFPLTDVPEGSTMHVVDTGEEYVFFDGVWEQDLRLIAALRAV